MLRIGIMCHSSFGGSVRIATELAIELVKRGHTVHLFARTLPFGHWDTSNGVKLHIISPTQDYPSPAELHLDWQEKETSRFLSEILKIAPSLDILHFHYAVPFAFVASEVKRQLGSACPLLVGTLHGTDVSIYGHDPIRGPQLTQALRTADVLTTVSLSHAALATEIFDLSIPPQVISNFVDFKKFHPRSNEKHKINEHRKPRIAHLSNFRAVKRPEAMAKIFLEIRKEMDVELWLIGDGPEMNKIKTIFHQNNIDDDIRYWGLQHDVAPLLAQTDLLLITSQAESFCLAALEAMACAIPVMASRVGGIPEVVIDGKTGLLFDLDEPHQATRAALGLLHDPERYQQMSESAFLHARSYDIHQSVLDYEALYLRHMPAILEIPAYNETFRTI